MSATVDRIRETFDFWRWFRTKGVRMWWTRALVAYVVLGVFLHWLLPGTLEHFATNAMIPIASILIALTFAWTSNANALLQTPEVRKVGMKGTGQTYLTWVYFYQSTLLLVFSVAVLWAVIAGGALGRIPVDVLHIGWLRATGRTLIFALTAMTMRECWQVALNTQRFLVMHAGMSQQSPKDGIGPTE